MAVLLQCCGAHVVGSGTMFKIVAVTGIGFAVSAIAFAIHPGLGLLVFLLAVPICHELLS